MVSEFWWLDQQQKSQIVIASNCAREFICLGVFSCFWLFVFKFMFLLLMIFFFFHFPLPFYTDIWLSINPVSYNAAHLSLFSLCMIQCITTNHSTFIWLTAIQPPSRHCVELYLCALRVVLFLHSFFFIRLFTRCFRFWLHCHRSLSRSTHSNFIWVCGSNWNSTSMAWVVFDVWHGHFDRRQPNVCWACAKLVSLVLSNHSVHLVQYMCDRHHDFHHPDPMIANGLEISAEIKQ